eukprot:CAMPEP_0175686048 /NCGR_PEP_ID=MMETSP0097-20121207/27671_1 /TAXON_ID=311494 /ORGANISM="Alexandrium monilatum, Strain CCMP3105" /LENGTH=79 /DNA_ID=CAMNT_0016993035 /DNA_START=48 /DNA_END=283 /DNA_ORIENTATION=-
MGHQPPVWWDHVPPGPLRVVGLHGSYHADAKEVIRHRGGRRLRLAKDVELWHLFALNAEVPRLRARRRRGRPRGGHVLR